LPDAWQFRSDRYGIVLARFWVWLACGEHPGASTLACAVIAMAVAAAVARCGRGGVKSANDHEIFMF